MEVFGNLMLSLTAELEAYRMGPPQRFFFRNEERPKLGQRIGVLHESRIPESDEWELITSEGVYRGMSKNGPGGPRLLGFIYLDVIGAHEIMIAIEDIRRVDFK